MSKFLDKSVCHLGYVGCIKQRWSLGQIVRECQDFFVGKFLGKLVYMLKKMRNIFLVSALLAVAIPPLTAQAAIVWNEIFYDTDGDYGVGYYAAIDYFQIATSDNSDDMIVIISPQYETSAFLFTSSGYGGVFFDTDGDSVDDIHAYAPRSTLSTTNYSNTRQIYRGVDADIATGCYSTWILGSDRTYYAVFIPWRCLGAPTSIRASTWLSNAVGYDLAVGDRTVYPVIPAATTTTVAETTTTTTTVAPTTTTTVAPTTTVDMSLSCDGVVAKNLKTVATFQMTTAVSNAGRLLKFEYYENGKWKVLGQARVVASGKATLNLKKVSISKIGSYPIRATQGSRFICEGDLTVTQKLKAYKK